MSKKIDNAREYIRNSDAGLKEMEQNEDELFE